MDFNWEPFFVLFLGVDRRALVPLSPGFSGSPKGLEGNLGGEAGGRSGVGCPSLRR